MLDGLWIDKRHTVQIVDDYSGPQTLPDITSPINPKKKSWATGWPNSLECGLVAVAGASGLCLAAFITQDGFARKFNLVAFFTDALYEYLLSFF